MYTIQCKTFKNNHIDAIYVPARKVFLARPASQRWRRPSLFAALVQFEICIISNIDKYAEVRRVEGKPIIRSLRCGALGSAPSVLLHIDF